MVVAEDATWIEGQEKKTVTAIAHIGLKLRANLSAFLTGNSVQITHIAADSAEN